MWIRRSVLTLALFAGLVIGWTAPMAHAEGKDGALLFIQGKLKPDGGEAYTRYLAGTQPLMAEYGAEIVVVGGGVESAVTTDAWPINAVLRFPDRERAEGFLSDARYLEIKKDRDAAYETLHLTLVQEREANVESPEKIARAVFAEFRDGLATGRWDPFFARLDDDFTFRFPTGSWRGTHRGKEKAIEFFSFVSQAYPEGLEVLGEPAITVEGQRAIFEFEDEGELFGQPYHNFVAISMDLCGAKVCGYREYFGELPVSSSSGSSSSRPADSD